MAKQDTMVKCWTLTINNPTDEDQINPDLCVYMIQANEIGEDGTKHWQMFLHLKVKIRFSTMKKICPRGHIEKAQGSDWRNRVYCSKGEQPKEEWERMKENGPNYGKNASILEWGTIPKAPKEKDTTYEEALDANTIEEGIKVVKDKRPRDYCIHGEAIERNLKRHKNKKFVPKYTMEQFSRGPLTLEKSTLICGDTNCGKTHFACAHFKNPLLVSHIDKVKTLSADNDGIIFDDMSFRHWPPEAVIHLLDQDFDREINVRYNTAFIPANTRKIFTHNSENPFYNTETTSVEQQLAIERRLNRTIIIGNLY